MKGSPIKVSLMLLLLAAAPLAAQSTMTDQQVLEYAQTAAAQGMSREQIAAQLARRGVTHEQGLRVKKLYEEQMGKAADGSTQTTATVTESRMRGNSSLNGVATSTDNVYSNPAPTRGLDASKAQMADSQAPAGNAPAASAPANSADQVFGRNIFNTQNLTFEPNINLATPPDYVLGPGDELIIDVWGASQNTIRQTISPDGFINIPDLGVVSVIGMKVSDATEHLRHELGKIYNGADNHIRVSLGNVRTIQINVMGEVLRPGTYALSSFSTVFHALYSAGGVSDIGSLRDVRVSRAGRVVAHVDVYQFIMQGKTTDDIRLQEGDVIIVPAYSALVQIKGKVKRPMRYEMRSDESLATLIKYAGGFASDAYRGSLRVVRQNGREYAVNTVDDGHFADFHVQDGDVVTIDPMLNRFANRLEIKGAVYRPGVYEFSGRLNTVKALLHEADGLLGDAFTARAVLYRQRENLTSEVLPVDIEGIMAGTSPDVALRKNDVLYIPSIHDLKDNGTLRIFGEVTAPGEYPYADNMTLEDLIITAGGLRDAASTVRVDVSRRIRDPKGTLPLSDIGHNYSFSLKDGFVIDGQPGFVLQPYDQVFVRRSPSYIEQQNVSIAGEVVYGGTYALSTKNERLTSLLAKAGGATPFAYIRGAKLTRRANAEEKKRMLDVVNMMRKELGDGAIDSMGIRVEDTFTVGIDLEKALKNPGSDADLVLREGDSITVPEYANTVKISGSVMMANTVTYQPGKSVRYYLSQAGGYSQNARKHKKFIVYMNGMITKVKGSGRRQIEPGCEIIVPNRRRRPAQLAEILSATTSFASVGTMLATMANLIKK